ncbi:flagellar hook-basal body complex protein [Schlesneria paludicola]|uniref:flagellar hook-basal body complex protein n=1 Tax=Schlesneria paludicola TaxID=360056 RepID=UPI00029B4D87|nr:flagellar hook-basal body complex protein [Schlesneria paludicola]
MIPALFTSSSALGANQLMLGVVGNNLANSNTAGYKSQTLLFSNQFSQLLSGGSQPTGVTGGKNPLQVGMGVQVAGTTTNQTQGTFQPTGNPLDLAIQDGGYFILNNGGQTVYTRFGSFNADANGTMVDPTTGAKLQRIGTIGEATATTPAFQIPGDTDIKIPKGLTIPGSATTQVTFTGNLNANAVGPLAQVLTSGQALVSGGVAATLNTALNALDKTTISSTTPTGYAVGDQISISGTRVDGTQVNATYTLTGDPTQDTVGGLLSAINKAFLSGTTTTGSTATLDSTGRIVLTANQPGPASTTLSLGNVIPTPSGTATQFSNFVQSTTGKAGDTSTTVIPVYDSQGTPHNVTFAFQKISDNRWNITASMDPSEGTISGFGLDNTVAGVTFNSDGTLQSIAGNSTSEVLVSKNPMTTGGVAATAATTLESLDQHLPAGTPYGPSDTIQISGVGFTGNTIAPVSVPAFDPVTGNPATVGDLLTAINSAFGNAVATLDSSGNIVFSASSQGQTSLSLKIADSLGNTGGSTTNFSGFTEAVRGTNGDGNIKFQINNLAGFGSPQQISLNLGTPDKMDGIYQTGSNPTITASNQDGFAQGTLETYSVNLDGVITGKFSNGKSESIAQIALANFTNPGGLISAGSNYLLYSTASGLPTISAPLSGSAGSIQSGGLEGSNVDVGSEFTNLIAAQRGYQVNAKAFSVANQLMQDAVDLIR